MKLRNLVIVAVLFGIWVLHWFAVRSAFVSGYIVGHSDGKDLEGAVIAYTQMKDVIEKAKNTGE